MARQSRKVAEALKTYYEGIFYELMIGMVKAKSYEADYARFGEEARSLTKRQLRQIAQYASEFFTSHSSNPAKLSKPAVERLQNRAFDHAARRFSDEREQEERHIRP